MPALRLLLKPHFTRSGAASHISVAYTIPPSDEAGPLLLFETFFVNVPSHPYSEADVHAEDDVGALPLQFVPTGRQNEQEWRPSRVVVGDLTLRMDVFPRKVDITTPLGTRIDLRTDQGGLQGAGRWFLPRVARAGIFTNIVDWDLSLAPPSGVRAVWSLGEGPGRVTSTGPSDVLTNTVYMVGPVNSFPPEPRPGTQPGLCACYWFGALPPNLDRLKGFNTALFERMARMYGDEDGSYRVFARSAVRGYGGTGFKGSYVLEYDPSTAQEPDDDVRALFAHEMVHSFSLMDADEDGEGNEWYIEGIAEFYAITLPYRFGLVSPSYVSHAVTSKLGGYFTNPDRHLPMREAMEQFFSSWYAEKIPYNRGFAYLLLIDARLRRLAGVADARSPGPLDDIVVDLSQRMWRGEKVVSRDWLRELGRWLDGTDYEAEFRGMLKGATVPIGAGTFVGSEANGLTMKRRRVLQFGFDRAALNTRVVGAVVPGSEAERAGLRVGDRIVRTDRGGKVQEDTEARYGLMVERGGEVFRVEWLPREEREVTCWELESFSG
ncbi:peptidase M61 domain-containing protein [Mycena rebaudengoi]|nr:peptidase M61 domain-containing protein [Mycena rebaudengoi]